MKSETHIRFSREFFKQIQISNSYSKEIMNNSNIDYRNVAILAIFHMHNQEIINDQKLKSYCKSYHRGTLIRKINTFHCKIIDRWYNDESTFQIIMTAFFEKCQLEDMSIEKLLFYINKLMNKNKNFCVDHLYFSFIDPIISNLNNELNIQLLPLMGIETNFISYDTADRNGNLSSGYCCKDCDGCLSEYKRSRYNNLLGWNWKSKLKDEVKLIFNSFKTKSAMRNMNNKLR